MALRNTLGEVSLSVAGLALVLACVAVGWPGGVREARSQGVFEVTDRVDLVHVDQQLLAIRAKTGAVLDIQLDVGERVFDVQSGGLMGVASTSSRLLGITAGSADWAELRYRLDERNGTTPRIYVQDRVALVTLPKRLVALSPRIKAWQQLPLSPGETDLEVLTDDQLAVVITPRRAIGFAADSATFAEVHLGPKERIERRSVEESSITLVTERRVLVFGAGAAAWTEVDRKKMSR